MSVPTRPPGEQESGERSDRSLLVLLRKGEQDAATQLYLRYAQRLRALVRSRCSPGLAQRLEPDDIVQSVFRRFFRHVMKGEYDVPPGEELWGLLLVIALNKVRSEEAFHRAARRDLRQDVAADPTAFPSGSADTAFLEASVGEALSLLPAPHRQLAELRIAGHDVAEIAASTGRSKRTVERLLQDVRTRLRSLIGAEA